MGLGPPVCKKCMVLMDYDGKRGYFCGKCDSDEHKIGLWELTHNEEKIVESNMDNIE